MVYLRRTGERLFAQTIASLPMGMNKINLADGSGCLLDI
jgi:hypothetical protein